MLFTGISSSLVAEEGEASSFAWFTSLVTAEGGEDSFRSGGDSFFSTVSVRRE